MGESFESRVQELGIRLSDTQKKQFDVYYETLSAWNEKINLTSLKSKEDIFDKHFLDSLHMALALNIYRQNILDVGSGAGFPGIPIKIVFPDIDLTIVDALNKRIFFLQALTEKLGFNVNIIHGRIEHHSLKNHYDIVTARAVAPLRVLSELCLPFVAKDGYFIAYKSKQTRKEIDEAKQAFEVLGGVLENVVHYRCAGIERTIVKIRKEENINSNYPRPFHKIKKNPL